MYSIHSITRWLSCSVLVGLLQLSAWATDARAHYLTLYIQPVLDGSTLHGYIDLWDHDPPYGCDQETDHYLTFATLNGPTGSSYAEGEFSAHVSLPAADGNYDLFGNGELGCTCVGTFYAAPVAQGLAIGTTWYGGAVPFMGGCGYEQTACTSGMYSCADIPLYVSGAPQPCAPYRLARYAIVNGNCLFAGSFGSSASTRICT